MRLTSNAQCFLTRLRPEADSTALLYSTWFGGTLNQGILAIEPDGQGGAVTAGPTVSVDIPVTSNAFQKSFGGVRDGFLAVHRMLPAVVTRFGHATSPCGRSTFLQTNSAPLAGNASFAVETHDAPAGALGALAFGTPLPAGIALINADLYLAPPFIAVPWSADANGFAAIALPLPVGFSWISGLALQSLWITPSTCGPGPLTASNALR